MERSSTTYMYICFKIRGEVWKNCKSWERNQDCTEKVSRQPARYHLQETLGASHHLLQEERHPGTQEIRDPGVNGSTSCTSRLPVIIQLQIHHLGSGSNQGATAPAGRFQGIIQPGWQMTECLLWWGGSAKGGRASGWRLWGSRWKAKLHFPGRLSTGKTPLHS